MLHNAPYKFKVSMFTFLHVVHKLFYGKYFPNKCMFLKCANIIEGLGSVSLQGIRILQATGRANPPPAKLKTNKK